EVSLEVYAGEYWVFFEGWHERFLKLDEAIQWFLLGLSDQCRLVEVRRGNFPYRWILEVKSQYHWEKVGETHLIFFPFWKGKNVRYLQNHWIRTGSAEEGIQM
ncbi:MAG: hypothetical protein NZ959_09070, partial [Armatimonadetes bacterium]|nr:hypothetical protein [Armatimonadota bacterium]